MPTVEFFNFTLPPDAWRKKPSPSRFKMTIEDAAKRYPGAQPILESCEVRELGSSEVFAAKDALYQRRPGRG